MARFIVRSNPCMSEQEFAEKEDFITQLMESVVLTPHPDVDSAIAECWSPCRAIDQWWRENADALYDEDAFGDYFDDIVDYSARVVGGVVAYFVKHNDVEGLCSYLRNQGIRVL